MARQRKARKREAESEDGLPLRWWNRRNGTAVAAATVAATAVLLLYFLTPLPSVFLPPPDSGDAPDVDFFGDVTITGGLLLYEPVWNPCTEDYRPDYGLECAEQRTIFGDLPKFPADTLDVAKLYLDGVVNAHRLIQEHPGTRASQYWMQPEFYNGWNQSFLNIQRQPPRPIWTPFGYNFYPWGSGLTVGRNSPESQQGFVDMLVFFRAGWGTDTWQGFHMFPAYPEVARKQDGTPMCFVEEIRNATGVLACPEGQEIRQDPTEVPFTVSIQNPSDRLYTQLVAGGIVPEERLEGGQFFVMPPSHPSFTQEWVRLLTLRITFTETELTPGFYFLTLLMRNASPEVNQEYFIDFGNFYQPSGSWPVTSLTPLFQGFVVII